MSKILLYIDEDSMDEDFVQALRSQNADVLTVADVGMLHRSNLEQLDCSRENDRVIFSFNTRDFYVQIKGLMDTEITVDERVNPYPEKNQQSSYFR
jgi:hypothetical protein